MALAARKGQSAVLGARTAPREVESALRKAGMMIQPTETGPAGWLRGRGEGERGSIWITDRLETSTWEINKEIRRWEPLLFEDRSGGTKSTIAGTGSLIGFSFFFSPEEIGSKKFEEKFYPPPFFLRSFLHRPLIDRRIEIIIAPGFSRLEFWNRVRLIGLR